MLAGTSECWDECEASDLPSDGSQPVLGLLMMAASGALSLSFVCLGVRFIAGMFIH